MAKSDWPADALSGRVGVSIRVSNVPDQRLVHVAIESLHERHVGLHAGNVFAQCGHVPGGGFEAPADLPGELGLLGSLHALVGLDEGDLRRQLGQHAPLALQVRVCRRLRRGQLCETSGHQSDHVRECRFRGGFGHDHTVTATTLLIATPLALRQAAPPPAARHNHPVYKLAEIFMGYKLRRWLAEALPDGLSSGERLVALEVADQAHEDTRRAYGANLMDVIVRRTGLSDPKQVGKILGKLGAAGVELRVPATDKTGQVLKDKQGRTVYACRGHMLEFRIPQPGEFPALKVPQAGELNEPKVPPAGELSDPQEEKGPPPGPERSPARGTKVPLAGDPTSHISSVISLSGCAEPDADVSHAPTTEREIVEGESERANPGSAVDPAVERIVAAWVAARIATRGADSVPQFAPDEVARSAREVLAEGVTEDVLHAAVAVMAPEKWMNFRTHLAHWTPPPVPGQPAPGSTTPPKPKCRWCDHNGLFEHINGTGLHRCTHPDDPPPGHPDAADTRSAA